MLSHQKDGKIIDELEGLDYQFEVIDKVYTIDTLKQCISGCHEGSSKEAVNGFRSLYELYMNGDSKFLDELLRQDHYEFMGNNYNIFIKDRDISIVKKIGQLAVSGEKYLVAVGAGHYAVDDSIIKKLG